MALSSAVLFDGWSLTFFPGSPAAIHLLELLEALPAGIQPWVALPDSVDSKTSADLFGNLRVTSVRGGEAYLGQLPPGQNENGVFLIHAPASIRHTGRLRWEQVLLPRLARQVHARRIHVFSLNAPLFSPAPVSISPVEEPLLPAPADGLFARMRLALGKGGVSQADGVIWPGDLPLPGQPAVERVAAPLVHSAFRLPQPFPAGLPEEYVLAPGRLAPDALHLLAVTWNWAVSGLGDGWTLCVCDLDPAGLEYLRSLCDQPVISVSADLPRDRAALFQHCSAVLSLGPVHAWGDPLLQSLACARPLVAEETPLTSARVGPAAYLAKPGDARGLGAALITVIIEPDFSEQLCQAARDRARGWDEPVLATSRG